MHNPFARCFVGYLCEGCSDRSMAKDVDHVRSSYATATILSQTPEYGQKIEQSTTITISKLLPVSTPEIPLIILDVASWSAEVYEVA